MKIIVVKDIHNVVTISICQWSVFSGIWVDAIKLHKLVEPLKKMKRIVFSEIGKNGLSLFSHCRNADNRISTTVSCMGIGYILWNASQLQIPLRFAIRIHFTFDPKHFSCFCSIVKKVQNKFVTCYRSPFNTMLHALVLGTNMAE